MHDIYRAEIVGQWGSRGIVAYRNINSNTKFQKSEIRHVDMRSEGFSEEKLM